MSDTCTTASGPHAIAPADIKARNRRQKIVQNIVAQRCGEHKRYNRKRLDRCIMQALILDDIEHGMYYIDTKIAIGIHKFRVKRHVPELYAIYNSLFPLNIKKIMADYISPRVVMQHLLDDDIDPENVDWNRIYIDTNCRRQVKILLNYSMYVGQVQLQTRNNKKVWESIFWPNLTYLNISNLDLDSFDIYLPNCRSFTCKNNNLMRLPDIPACKKLICSNNRLQELPELKDLVRLDCSGNDIEIIPDFPHCVSIVCSNNPIKEFQGIYPCCILFVCRNSGITDLPPLSACRHLVVSYNGLNSMNINARIGILESLCVYGNPGFENLVSWLLQDQKSAPQAQLAICKGCPKGACVVNKIGMRAAAGGVPDNAGNEVGKDNVRNIPDIRAIRKEIREYVGQI